MKTLCMDTSHRFLVLALIEDDKIINSYSVFAWKRQSETIFVELIRLMDEANWKPDDIDEVVITKGPGSYTGIRIAMSIAKVFCTSKHKPLYTISTLQLYAGLDTCSVILDARSNRVYYGKYEGGKLLDSGIKTIDEIKTSKEVFIGDTTLLDQEIDNNPNFVDNFNKLRPFYETVDNIHGLVPTYWKEEQAYLVK